MSPAEVEAYVDAAAAVLRLPLDPAHRPGVLNFFALAAGMAALVEAHPLGPSDDPAAAFVPVSPGEARPSEPVGAGEAAR